MLLMGTRKQYNLVKEVFKTQGDRFWILGLDLGATSGL